MKAASKLLQNLRPKLSGAQNPQVERDMPSRLNN
jgi:hypothetical protein